MDVHPDTTGTALCGARIFDSRQLWQDCAILVRHGRVEAIVPSARCPDDYSKVDLSQRLIVPGLVDLQVNGGGGVLFNDTPTRDGLRAIHAAHYEVGTAAILPTLITAPQMVRDAAIAAVSQVEPHNGILGIHLEGPYLNPDKSGIHDPHWMAPAPDTLPEFSSGSGAVGSGAGGSKGRFAKLITLAPEQASPDRIRGFCDAGWTVALGHSTADYDTAMDAFDAGASGATHLFNAMPPLLHRAPGLVGAVLDHPEVWCGVIADGFHVDWAVLRLVIRAKPAGKVVLVSDSMPVAGAPDMNSFSLNGYTIHRRDGRLVNDAGTLAGADLTLATAVGNAITYLDVSPWEAIRMASLYPAQALGIDKEWGRIEPGSRARFTLLDADKFALAGMWPDASQLPLNTNCSEI